MNIQVKVIPHSHQRYNTVGDWFYDKNGSLQVRVSEISDGRVEQLVAVRELIVALLCDAANVDEGDVTAFNVAFEKHRLASNDEEAGEQANAPQHRQHRIASAIMSLLANELKVNVKEMKNEVSELRR